jgi:hypothetical protein
MKVHSKPFNYHEYYKEMNQKVSKITNVPLVVIICAIIIFFIVISNLFSSSPTTTASPYDIGSSTVPESSGPSFLGVLIVTGIVLTMLILGLKYLFNIDIYTELKNIYTNHPEIDLNIDTHPKKHIPNKQHHHHKHKKKHHKDKKQKVDYPTLSSPEVFHISDNKYSYDDARAVCKAFNSRLATYDEVEQAYNSGGEWCSYGWSRNGLALFPTQKRTYNKLQKIKGYKNVCGRPGINGGYIKDKHMKFGANCYGIKPEINNVEKELMKKYKVYPPSKDERKLNHRAQHYKKKLSEILITPFNKKEWSE